MSMDQQAAMEKEGEEHEAEKSNDEELPKSSIGKDQQAPMEKEGQEHGAEKSDDEELPKLSMGMDQEAPMEKELRNLIKSLIMKKTKTQNPLSISTFHLQLSCSKFSRPPWSKTSPYV